MAMTDNRTFMDEEIERLLTKLSDLDPTSEEYRKTMEHLQTAYRLCNEQDKARMDFDAKMVCHEDELQLEKQKLEAEQAQFEIQRADSKKAMIVHAVCDGLKFVGTLAFGVLTFVGGLKFEETGAYCSKTFSETRTFAKNLFKK